jgi:predicted PurR-regulated permease PerM
MTEPDSSTTESSTRSPRGRDLPPGFVAKAATVLGLFLVALLIVAILWHAVTVLLVVFAGILLGVFLLALSTFIADRTPISAGWSLALVIVLLLGLLVGGVAFLMPQLAEQVDEFNQRLPEIMAQLEEFLGQYGWGTQLLEQIRGGQMMEGGGGAGGEIAAGVAGVLGWIAQAATYLVALLFIGLFVAVNPSLYVNGLVKMFPPDRRERTRDILAEIGYTLRWFLVARAIAMALVGISTGIALWLLDVPLALLLGFVAGLLTFVPYLGPVIAAIPILLVSLLAGPTTALWVLVVYTAIQQVEGNIFDPLILQRIIHLPPAMTVIAQILGSALLGALGLALATPFAAVLQVLLRRVYREDILGEPREPLEHES